MVKINLWSHYSFNIVCPETLLKLIFHQYLLCQIPHDRRKIAIVCLVSILFEQRMFVDIISLNYAKNRFKHVVD